MSQSNPTIRPVSHEVPPYNVTFEAEKRLKHAATLFIVFGYIYIALFALTLVMLLIAVSDQGY
jgi:hypothetical protein